MANINDMTSLDAAEAVYDTLERHLPGWSDHLFILIGKLKGGISGRGFATERLCGEHYAECVRQFLDATFPDDVTGVRVTVTVEDMADRPLVIGGEL